MSEISRRNAVKCAAVTAAAGIVSVGAAASASAQTQGAKRKKVSLEFQDPPVNWGQEGDQTFKVKDGDGIGTAGFYGSNCNEKKDEIVDRGFDCVKFGSCSHPTPVDADVTAAELMLEVLAEGCVINTEFGHRTVKNKTDYVSFNTYLSYAAGDRP